MNEPVTTFTYPRWLVLLFLSIPLTMIALLLYIKLFVNSQGSWQGIAILMLLSVPFICLLPLYLIPKITIQHNILKHRSSFGITKSIDLSKLSSAEAKLKRIYLRGMTTRTIRISLSDKQGNKDLIVFGLWKHEDDLKHLLINSIVEQQVTLDANSQQVLGLNN